MPIHHPWLLDVAQARYPNRHALTQAVLPAKLGDAWELVANLAGVSTAELAHTIAEAHQLRVAEPGRPDRSLARLLPQAAAEKFNVAPVALERGVLLVATADPTQTDVMAHLRFAAGGRPVQACIATPSEGGCAG